MIPLEKHDFQPTLPETEVTGFWAADVWDLRQCPLAVEAHLEGPPLRLRFDCQALGLNREIKLGYRHKYLSGEWKITVPEYRIGLHRMVRWLNEQHLDRHSFLEESLSYWELSLGSWALKHRVDRMLPMQMVRQVYRVALRTQAVTFGFERDVVELKQIGLASPLEDAHSLTHLDFSRIVQPWLRTVAKSYLAWRSTVLAAQTSRAVVSAITEFSQFLDRVYPEATPERLDRAVIVRFLKYTSDLKHSSGTRGMRLSLLRSFLELCSREGIAPFSEKRLIYDDDFPVRPLPAPRAIPSEVFTQVMQILNPPSLCAVTPVTERVPSLKRVVLLLANCGMRVSEALTMSFNCLEKDADGDWFLRYYQSKVRCEQTQPISTQTAALIQAQQQDVRNWRDESPRWLFPNREGLPFTARAVHRLLTDLQAKSQIRDATGQVWHFHAHQFRHTFATTLINRGMSLYEVQLMLGHKSPGMAQRYARVHHETLKQKYKAALEARTLVDLSGKVYREENSDDAAELKILKQGFTAQTLPHGWCAYPVALGSCPHANSCYSCRHWRTDQSKLPILQTHLAETQALITQATEQGWHRVVEMNTTVAHNLTRVIQVLKGDDDGTST